uniref:NADH-ubiquinone oxidoreductase chain 2 n=1 Tax=Gobiidae sp. TaxID=3040165 RepID=A0AA95Z417_9GOBI|nr:NADH dehydrogenase subunit 2 [Gobiidae sp.]
MAPFTQFMLMFGLGLGMTITLSASHWLIAWIGLEINTLAIIPMMSCYPHPRATEATTKYFVAQATATATLLFAAAMNAWLTGQWSVWSVPHPLPTWITILALSAKMGLAPFHTWVPEVLQGVDLISGLILSTWQKLAPLCLILQLPIHPELLLPYMGVFSAFVGGLGGLNQTQLRKVLAYSSITHLGWMFIILGFSRNMAVLAFMAYTIMTSALFLSLNFFSVKTINGLSTSWSKCRVLATSIPFTLFSLGGLPPFAGFLPKWMIIQQLLNEGLPEFALVLAFASLLSLYFYLRLAYALALTVSPLTLPYILVWRLPRGHTMILLSITVTVSIMALPLTPAVLAALSL